MKTTASDREIARKEILRNLEVLADRPAPRDSEGRAREVALCTDLATTLVLYFRAERAAGVGDVRLRARYLRRLDEILSEPESAGEERQRALIASFRLLLSSACMHLTTQQQRESQREMLAGQ